MPPVRLRHIHLRSSPSQGIYPTYQTAAALQELLRRRQLDYQDAESSSSPSRLGLTAPHPTLISFTPQPTYTLGRRQAHQSLTTSSSSHMPPSSLTPAEISRLKAPFHVRSSSAHSLPTQGLAPTSEEKNTMPPPSAEHIFHPSVLTSPRGGLATYHGPGQVVLWPVMVIRSSTRNLGHKHFTVRCYSRLLERTTISLLRRLFGLEGFTTDDPGVWVRTPPSAASSAAAVTGGRAAGGDAGEVRKISALGIHLRRHVSSLGAALNLDMPTTSASAAAASGLQLEEADNPWARFVACGLAGKGVTCVEEELRAAGGAGIPGLDAEVVARAWAEELAKGMELGAAGAGGAVELVGRDEVDELVGAARREGSVDAARGDEL
ncbi:hypothetical protein Daus18300_008358 [Diaporthe australafricana]|uniref:BPL/LPL catalytic domain-containing protein n=1 Tax=Diaporthe australafricana TaxID=127596 RepID=A0ABR3WIB6_9PEZI